METFPNNNDPGDTENNPDTSSHPGGVVNDGNGKNPKDSTHWSKTGGAPVPYSTEENHEDDPANMDAPF